MNNYQQELGSEDESYTGSEAPEEASNEGSANETPCKRARRPSDPV